MMKYLLDTNVLRHYTDGHQTLLDNLASVPLEKVAVPRRRKDTLICAELERCRSPHSGSLHQPLFRGLEIRKCIDIYASILSH